MNGDIHALSGAYAVDALDDYEREAFERHLADCSVCQAEVDGLREAAASLADGVALAAPDHLRDQVLAKVAAVRPLPPVVPITARRPSRRAWLSGTLLVAAAVALLVVWVRPHTPTSSSITAADQVIRAQDAVRVSQHLTSGATVVWYRSAKLDRAAIAVSGLPATATGKTYELWLQSPDGAMHPAGLLKGGTERVALRGAARSAIGAGLTVERAGGSTSPTLPATTLVTFPRT